MIKLEKMIMKILDNLDDETMKQVNSNIYLKINATKNFLNGNVDDARKDFKNLISDPDIPLEINTGPLNLLN